MKKALLFIQLFFLSALVFGQTDNLSLKTSSTGNFGDTTMNRVISGLQSLSGERIIEKAYVHTDKPYYNPGDTIYFKAYVTYGEKHQLSPISKVLYVNLINTTHQISQTLKILLTNGTGWGNLNLPDSMASGNYRLRAYTQWMRNFGDAYFFNKTIYVGNSSTDTPNTSSVQTSADPAAASTSVARTAVHMQFFPEGGEMVTGFTSKIAFKAVGNNGLGVDVKGVIKDDQNKVVANFTSVHLGMGEFELHPEAGKTYRAILVQPSGYTAAYALPEKKDAGLLLSVNSDDPKKMAVEIAVNQPYFDVHKNEDLGLVIYQAGIVKIVKAKLDGRLLGLNLPVSSFKTGIVKLTVFSSIGEPLSERLVFINNTDQISLNVDSLKRVYHGNEKVTVSMNVKGTNQQLEKGSFSVAVFHENKATADRSIQSNILTQLLLTSDLIGYVEQPDYYFTSNNQNTRKALDLLMLTEGYKRFVWKELLNNQVSSIAYSPEKALQITGTAVTTANQPVVNGKVTLFAQLDGTVLTTNTDRSGRFAFPNLIFMDSTRFILTTKTAAGKDNVLVKIDKSDKEPAVSSWTDPDPAKNLNPTEKMVVTSTGNPASAGDTSVSKPRKSIMLKTVTVKGYKADDSYRSSVLGGPGHADQVMHAKDLESMGTMVTALNGRLRGVTFIGNMPYLTLSVMSGIGANRAQPMMIIVDGAIVFSPGSPSDFEFDLINPENVETVEVLKSATASIYGMEGANGVLVITSKQTRNNEASTGMQSGMFVLTAHGFHQSKDFTAPTKTNYSTENLGDKNSTVYWKPDLNTDANGKASFQYDASADKGSYKMVIEGIDADGNIARAVYHYEVK